MWWVPAAQLQSRSDPGLLPSFSPPWQERCAVEGKQARPEAVGRAPVEAVAARGRYEEPDRSLKPLLRPSPKAPGRAVLRGAEGRGKHVSPLPHRRRLDEAGTSTEPLRVQGREGGS